MNILLLSDLANKQIGLRFREFCDIACDEVIE